WFERIVGPIERGEADVVAGWYELLVESQREKALGLLTQYSIDQIRPDTFLPSSRSVAFTMAAWQRVGGYPEDLDTTEDTVFDLRLREAGLRFTFEPRAIVRWRPAASLGAVYRMYRQFAESDGQARIFLMGGSRLPPRRETRSRDIASGPEQSVGVEEARFHYLPIVAGFESSSPASSHRLAFGGRQHEALERLA